LRLDRDAEIRDWRAAVAAAFGGRSVLMGAAGWMIMATMAKWVGAAVLVAVAAFVCWPARIDAVPAADGPPRDGGVAGAASTATAATETRATDAARTRVVAGTLPAPQVANATTATVRGRCLAAEDGRPLADCRCLVMSGGNTLATTATDGTGRFECTFA